MTEIMRTESVNLNRKRVRIMAIDKRLLEILACPKCKGDVILTEKKDGLVCNNCMLLYPIKDDIPFMLVDEAIRLDEQKGEG